MDRNHAPLNFGLPPQKLDFRARHPQKALSEASLPARMAHGTPGPVAAPWGPGVGLPDLTLEPGSPQVSGQPPMASQRPLKEATRVRDFSRAGEHQVPQTMWSPAPKLLKCALWAAANSRHSLCCHSLRQSAHPPLEPCYQHVPWSSRSGIGPQSRGLQVRVLDRVSIVSMRCAVDCID